MASCYLYHLQASINRDDREHTGRLVVVDVDAFQLDVLVADVRSSRVDSVLVRDDFPELRHTHSLTHSQRGLHAAPFNYTQKYTQ